MRRTVICLRWVEALISDWAIVTGSQTNKPSTLDTTSSVFFVYQRRNIERITIDDEMLGAYEMWQYEERKLTKDEYAVMVADEITATQIALTEMYERQMI